MKKASVADVWGTFLEQTSLHGCRNIKCSQRPLIQRCLWTIILLVMAAMLMNMLIDLYALYRSYPFRTKTSIIRERELDFPAITVCNFNNNYTSRTRLSKEWQRYHWIQESYGIFTSLKMDKPNVSSTLQESVDETGATEVEKFILQAKLGSNVLSVSKEFKRLLGCFSFNTDIYNTFRVTRAQELQLILDIQQDEYIIQKAEGAMIIVHGNDEMPDMSISTVSIEAGTYSKIKLTRTSYKFLPLPYKSFGDGTCFDVFPPDYTGNLKYHNKYTYFNCMLECYAIPANERCGCRLEDYIVTSGIRICDMSELLSCYWPEIEHMMRTVKCNCPQTCSQIQYSLQSSTARFPSEQFTKFLVDEKMIKSEEYARKSLMMVSIGYERMITQHVEHVPEMSWGDIFGKLGGQMGFFLGASLLTLTELLEALITTLKIVGLRLYDSYKNRVKLEVSK